MKFRNFFTFLCAVSLFFLLPVVSNAEGNVLPYSSKNYQADEIKNHPRAFMGIQPSNVNRKRAKRLGLESADGVYISKIIKGEAAEKAKLKRGDVITHIDGMIISDVRDLREALAEYQPGDKIKIGFWREGKCKKKKLKLGSR